MFRRAVLEDLSAIWGAGPAVVVQAVLCGAAHWAGFPSGGVGMLMAAAWGLVLGILRLRTRGIIVPYLVHVIATPSSPASPSFCSSSRSTGEQHRYAHRPATGQPAAAASSQRYREGKGYEMGRATLYKLRSPDGGTTLVASSGLLTLLADAGP